MIRKSQEQVSQVEYKLAECVKGLVEKDSEIMAIDGMSCDQAIRIVVQDEKTYKIIKGAS